MYNESYKLFTIEQDWTGVDEFIAENNDGDVFHGATIEDVKIQIDQFDNEARAERLANQEAQKQARLADAAAKQSDEKAAGVVAFGIGAIVWLVFGPIVAAVCAVTALFLTHEQEK